MPSIPEQKIETVIPDDAKGTRIDKALAVLVPDLSRGRIQHLLFAGHIRQTGDRERTIENAAHKVKPGERYVITVPVATAPDLQGEAIPLSILYEDDHLIVFDKPAGLVVHPAPGHSGGTIVNALIAHCGDSLSGIGGVKRPGIVHRLDKDTSGVMIAAKTDEAHAGLSEQFAVHTIERAYKAICWGAPRPRSGTIAEPLARSRNNRKKRAVVPGGKEAITHYKVEAIIGDPIEPQASLVECRLETGRTHQIRVHMTHIGHAVIGDPLYGRGRRAKKLSPETQEFLKNFNRQALHAAILGFQHPVTGETLKFSSPLPPELNALLRVLEAGLE